MPPIKLRQHLFPFLSRCHPLFYRYILLTYFDSEFVVGVGQPKFSVWREALSSSSFTLSFFREDIW